MAGSKSTCYFLPWGSGRRNGLSSRHCRRRRSKMQESAKFCGRPRETSTPRREPAQHFQADTLTLLRVKLRRKDVFVADRRCERRRVIRLRGGEVAVTRRNVIRMDEVNRGVLRHVTQRGCGLAHAQLVPTHVRHLQARMVAEAHHLAGKVIQPAIMSVLVAGRE